MAGIVIATEIDLTCIRWQHCHRKASKDDR